MATIITKIINSKWKILLLISFWTLSANLINQVASQSHNCSHVKCPPMSQITCPEDSYIREIKEESNLLTASDNYERIEEIFVHCCVTQKCSCRVCHIPSCHNTSLVLMETVPETETPGKCCGQYECIYEPNCTEIINSNGLHWLTDCQRCECISKERVCHRSCDETFMPPQNCISPNLNRFFSNGDTWKEDPCTICECHNGKNNCQINYCRPQSCKKTIKIPDECCPKCVEDSENIADVIIVTTSPAATINSSKLFPDDIRNDVVEEQTTEQIVDIIIQKTLPTTTTSSSSSTKSITTTPTSSPSTTTTSTTIKPIEIISTSPKTNIKPNNYDQIDEIHILDVTEPQPSSVKKQILLPEPTTTTTQKYHHIPCTTKEPPVTYSIDNSDTVQVIQPPLPQYCFLYVIITILSILLILFIVLYIHEKSKKRSYDPVPSTDDNFNKIATKIKAIECP